MFKLKGKPKTITVNTVSETAGQYEISKGVSKRELEKLRDNPKARSIQFSQPLNEKEIMLLETIIFCKRPDISLRVYGHYSDECDLKFIEQIPSLRRFSADCLMNAKGIEGVADLQNLEVLGVGIFNLDNFDFLKKINPGIKKLYLHQTRSKKPNIDIRASLKTLYF